MEETITIDDAPAIAFALSYILIHIFLFGYVLLEIRNLKTEDENNG